MATPATIALAPDTLQRSVWVVIDPQDLVTDRRMTLPLRVRLDAVAAAPIAGLSGAYCFTDLNVAAGPYVARVQPTGAARDAYFDAEVSFVLSTIPVTNDPLARNYVKVNLLPRPGYPFPPRTTLVRGRLARASDRAAVEGARIGLFVAAATDHGIRGRTDERGEFVVPFPPSAPQDVTAAGLETFAFELRFQIDGLPVFVFAGTVEEGKAISLHEIAFPGI